MNRDLATKELSGQTTRLLDLYLKKDEASQQIKKLEREVKEYDISIRELRGILQTLQFIVQTDGFQNIPKEREPVRMGAHTTLEKVNKVISGEKDA